MHFCPLSQGGKNSQGTGLQRHKSQEVTLSSGFRRPRRRNKVLSQLGNAGRTLLPRGRGGRGPRRRTASLPTGREDAEGLPAEKTRCPPTPRPEGKAGCGRSAPWGPRRKQRGSPGRRGLLNRVLCARRAARPGPRPAAGGGRAEGGRRMACRASQLRRRAAGGSRPAMNGALFAGRRGCPGQAGPAQRRLYASGMEMSPRPSPRSPVPGPARGAGMPAGRKGALARDAALAALKPH